MDYDKILNIIKEEASGKQLYTKYDTWFKDSVFNHNLGALECIETKFEPFKEYIPEFTEHEYQIIYDILKWVDDHNLTSLATNAIPCSTVTIRDKLSNYNKHRPAEDYEKLIEIVQGMKDGKKYQYRDINGWIDLSMYFNVSPTIESMKQDKLRVVG